MSTTGQTLHIAVTCYVCGGDVAVVADGTRRNWQHAYVVKCTECHWSGVVNAEVSTISTWEDQPRTEKAWIRHAQQGLPKSTRRQVDQNEAGLEHWDAWRRSTATIERELISA